MPIKRKPKDTRRSVEKALDKLWSQIVLKSWGYKCAMCGGLANQPHHYFHKAQGLRARWTVENGVALCFPCHIRKVHQKGDVEPCRDAIIQKIGEVKFNSLKFRSKTIWKPTADELRALKAQFEQLLSN